MVEKASQSLTPVLLEIYDFLSSMTELGRIEFMEDARIDKIALYNIGQNSLMIKLGWLWVLPLFDAFYDHLR